MTIPYLHPLAVHFPIALLIVGALASVAWLATGRAFWRHVTLGLVLIGTVGAVTAKQTGEEIEHALEERPGFDEVRAHEHEDRAEQTVVVSLLALGALVGAEVRARRRAADAAADPLVVRAVATSLVVGAGALVGVTGHLGGQMTWGVADGAAAAAPAPAPGSVASPGAGVSTDQDGGGD